MTKHIELYKPTSLSIQNLELLLKILGACEKSAGRLMAREKAGVCELFITMSLRDTRYA